MRGDINLLPKKKSGEITKLATGFIIAIFVLLGIVAVVFVYMPNMERRRIRKEIEQKKSELAEQTATKEEYNKLNEEFNFLKERNMVFNNIIDRNIAFSGILEDFELIIPTSIVLDELAYTSGFLNIKGTTPSPLELSQFMVNLRKLDKVVLVSLSTMEFEPVQNTEEDNTELYTFELSVLFYEDVEEDTEEDFEENIDSQEDTTGESDSEEVTTEEGAQ